MKEPQEMHEDLEGSVPQVRAHAGVCSFYLQKWIEVLLRLHKIVSKAELMTYT